MNWAGGRDGREEGKDGDGTWGIAGSGQGRAGWRNHRAPLVPSGPWSSAWRAEAAAGAGGR